MPCVKWANAELMMKCSKLGIKLFCMLKFWQLSKPICIFVFQCIFLKKNFHEFMNRAYFFKGPLGISSSVKYSKNSHYCQIFYKRLPEWNLFMQHSMYLHNTYVRCHIFWYITQKFYTWVEFDIQFEFFVSPPHPKYVYAHIFQIHMNYRYDL